MPFEFAGHADIKGINIRKGSADDSQVSVDIKLAVDDIPLGTAAAALGAEDPEDLKRALFRSVAEDAEESARFFGIDGISSVAAWEDRHAITIAGFRRLRAHKVGKISVVPTCCGRFSAAMQVTIQQPPSGFVEALAEHINSVVEVRLEHDQELPLPVERDLSKASRGEKRTARADVNRALQ